MVAAYMIVLWVLPLQAASSRFNEALKRLGQRPMGRAAFKRAMEENGFHSSKHAVTGNSMTYFGLRRRTPDLVSVGFDSLN